MPKHARKEAIDCLTEQLKATTDPNISIKLSEQIAKLHRLRKKSISAPKSETPRKGASLRDLETYNHWPFTEMSDEELLLNHKVELGENRINEQRKQLGRKLTQAEEDAIFQAIESEVAEAGYLELIQQS